MVANKENKIKEMSDAEFLSFLYSERDREEKISIFQGWNIWAILGAIITIVCAGYGILCKNYDYLDWLKTGYLLSLVISVLIFSRLMSLAYFSFNRRGVDYRRVKYLKDVAPSIYLNIAIFCSIALSVFFLIAENDNRWSIVPFKWFFLTFVFVFARVQVKVNKDKVVPSYLDGITFANMKQEVCFGAIVGGLSFSLFVSSLRRIRLPLLGAPEFELAVCAVVIIILTYLLFTVKKGIMSWARIDVLLDDFIYKDRSKESVIQQLSSHRMGSTALEACSHELNEIKVAFDDFEPMKKKIEEVLDLLSDEGYDGNNLQEHHKLIKSSTIYLNGCNNRLQALSNRLFEILKVEPLLYLSDDCNGLMTIVKALLEREKEMKEVMENAALKMSGWIEKYYCRKYCCCCLMKDCDDRNDRMLLKYRLRKLAVINFPNAEKYFNVWRDGC